MNRRSLHRLWLGLVSLGLGCAHPHATALPPRVAANVASARGPHDEFRAVTVGNQQYLCVIRVGADNDAFLLWPKPEHPARALCEKAYAAWQRSSQ